MLGNSKPAERATEATASSHKRIAQTLSVTVCRSWRAQPLSPATRACKPFYIGDDPGVALRFTPGFMLSPAPQAGRVFQRTLEKLELETAVSESTRLSL